MITMRRTGTFPAKNFAAVLAWGREICAYSKSKFGVETTLQIPIGGNPNRICFVMNFENLASVEQAMQKSMSDPKFMEMNAKGSDICIVGSAVDELWTSV